MSDDFAKPLDELKRLAEEISLLRRELHTASAALNRIEKRIRAAFPDYPKSKTQSRKQSKSNATESTKDRTELLSLFENLLEATKSNGDIGFSSEIAKLAEEDIIALAYELGVTNTKRIGLRKAQEGIRKRVQESMLLSYGRKE